MIGGSMIGSLIMLASSIKRCRTLRAVWYPGSLMETPLSLGPVASKTTGPLYFPGAVDEGTVRAGCTRPQGTTIHWCGFASVSWIKSVRDSTSYVALAG